MRKVEQNCSVKAVKLLGKGLVEHVSVDVEEAKATFVVCHECLMMTISVNQKLGLTNLGRMDQVRQWLSSLMAQFTM